VKTKGTLIVSKKTINRSILVIRQCILKITSQNTSLKWQNLNWKDLDESLNWF